MKSVVSLALGCTLLTSAAAPASTPRSYVSSSLKPPAPLREFRGAWIATVGNIDWPSQPGLPAAQQKAELLAIIEMARQLRLNAVLLQVRPACDALYPSLLEPWSEYLSGQMGKPPQPFYDPLSFAVEEAHKRGLELHAWFNPFRAGHTTRKSPIAATHISKARPQLVRTYGRELWLDPGDRAVHQHSLAVMLDVVRRYNVDGIVIDDYFYPYPVNDREGRAEGFPDGATWRTYQQAGGRLTLDDWRRENVNVFIQQLYARTKAEKSWVKVGISPFGIWRPGHPPSVKGLDAYARLYADSRKWLEQGWLDYCVPQLYWSIGAREQGYADLLKWWCAQNKRARHLWPGNSTSRVGVGRDAEEIINQIRLTRGQPGAGGNVHWGARALLRNKEGVTELLKREVYQQAALMPASPWLDNVAPPAPRLDCGPDPKGLRLSWQGNPIEPVACWLLQIKNGGQWSTEILPSYETTRIMSSAEAVALCAVDRCGNTSQPAVFERPAP
jgi:uncharacterized lipoprotein YddW (UPF0748 family)